MKAPLNQRNGYKDKQRISAIHSIPCALCEHLGEKQTTRTTAHHKIGMGLGKKASDILSMSLCESHHQTGPYAIHHIGRVAWEKHFGVTQDELIEMTTEMLNL